MINATDPIDLLRQRNPIPPGSLYEAAAEQAAGVLAKLRTDSRLDLGLDTANRSSANSRSGRADAGGSCWWLWRV